GPGALTCIRVPECLAVEHPEHARVRRIVLLKVLRLAAHELEAGSPLLRGCSLGRGERDAKAQRSGEAGRPENPVGPPAHSTRISAVSRWACPSSSIHRNAMRPLSVAT